MPLPQRISDRVAGFAVFLFLLAVYVLTLCPTVGVGDSGELTTAAAVLGIPHPTGYPLYILSGRLFLALFPFGEVALRMNLFSALAAAGTGAVLYFWFRAWNLARPAAAAASLTLGLSLSFWAEANIARVYCLNALLFALCLYYGVRPERSFRSRSLFFLFWGLGLANHTLAIIIGILVIGLEVADWRTLLRQWKSVLFVLPGLLLYAFIPLRARMEPAINFGNPATPGAFWSYLRRSEYLDQVYLERVSDLLPILAHDLSTVPREITWLGVALIPLGMAHLLLSRAWGVLVVSVGLFLLNAVVVGLHGSAQDIFHWSRYMIPGYIGVVTLIAWGLAFLPRLVATSPESGGIDISTLGETRRVRPLIRSVAVLAPIALPVILLASNYVPNNRSRDYMAYTYNYRILAALPPGAILMATGDNNVFPLMYLQEVEGIRRDVKLIASYYRRKEAVPLIVAPGLFYTNILFDRPDGTYPRVEGLLFRLLDKPDAPRISHAWQGWRIPEMNDLNLERRDMLTRLLASQYWFFAGMAIPEGRDLLFQRSLDISHDYDRMWEQIGKTYFLYGQWKKAEPIVRRAVKLNPKNKDAMLLLKAIEDTLRATAMAGDTTGAAASQ